MFLSQTLPLGLKTLLHLQSGTSWQSSVAWCELQGINIHVHPYNEVTLQKFIWSQAV